MSRHPWRLVVAVVCALALTGACGGGGDPEPSPDRVEQIDGQKYGTGEERVDVAPLTERYAGLGTPEEAVWFSGTIGPSSDRVPGPSTYWIDAVITVDAATARRLSATGDPGQGQPDVVPDLRDEIEGLDLRPVKALDLSSDQALPNSAWLDLRRRVVVVTALGE